MKTNRRRALHALALLPFAISAAAADADAKNEMSPINSFVGSWFTIADVTSFILSIEPQMEALYLRSESGTFNICRVNWKPMPGGLLVQCVPRLRFWHGRNINEVRVEREDFPKTDVTEAFKDFPQAFMMKRVEFVRLPPALADRPMPANWDNAQLPANWDQRAGRRNK